MKKNHCILILLVLLCGIQTVSAEWVKRETNSLAWFKDIYFFDQDKGWMAGTDGVLLSTVDGGLTWVQVKKFTNDALLQIYFSDETTGWLLCERNVFNRGSEATTYLRKTTDGGRTWDKIEFQDSGRQRITKLLFNRDGLGTAFGEAGAFYKLETDGILWKKSLTSMRYLLLDGGYFEDRIGAIVGAAGTIMFTEDGGFTWERATLIGEKDTRFNAVYFAGQKAAWAVGQKGRIFHSSGGGRLWRQQESYVAANLNDVYFTTENSGWAVGDDGVIIRTRDAGRNWNEVSSKTNHRLEKIIFNAGRGWAIGYGGTVLTYDEQPPAPSSGAKPILMKRG